MKYVSFFLGILTFFVLWVYFPLVSAFTGWAQEGVRQHVKNDKQTETQALRTALSTSETEKANWQAQAFALKADNQDLLMRLAAKSDELLELGTAFVNLESQLHNLCIYKVAKETAPCQSLEFAEVRE